MIADNQIKILSEKNLNTNQKIKTIETVMLIEDFQMLKNPPKIIKKMVIPNLIVFNQVKK